MFLIKKRRRKMADEIKKEETLQEEKKEENGKEEKAEETVKETEKVENPVPEEKKEEETGTEAVVNQAEEQGNGIPLEAVALKTDVESMIKEAINAFQSKLDSVLKENADLKEQLAQSKSETENVRKKYEDNGDFGTSQKKGAGFTDGKSGNSPYVSYEEMWNGAKNFTKQGE